MHPTLFQLNTRVHLTRLARQLNRPTTLDDLPDSLWVGLAERGFEWVWLLSVWGTGEVARAVSRSRADWRSEFEHTLPDLEEADIGGSGFAITDYAVHPQLGGAEALARLRLRLRNHGLKLLLDFVPNHLAPDHPWVAARPDLFVPGSNHDLETAPHNYFRVATAQGERIVAHGRDPFFDGWPDTVQLDYSNLAVVELMTRELLRIAEQCDGVRCDMAMLLLPDIFERTWGRLAAEFWPEAIGRVRERFPQFMLLAEVYWNREWDLQQRGFDFTYDKQLYDRLRSGVARTTREHLRAEFAYQNRLARFLENHDEPRVAAGMTDEQHQAAAIVTYFVPGLRFFHEGQIEGYRVRISPHLVRGPDEVINQQLFGFYQRLLRVLQDPVFHQPTWKQLECRPAWDGNESCDHYICFAWSEADRGAVEAPAGQMIVVNYGPHRAQCFVNWPDFNVAERLILSDRMSDAKYERELSDLRTRGLYLDLPAWGYHIFSVASVATTGLSSVDDMVVSN
ncbi:MAG: alpha-amylase family glycosyl hydrolase [Planctomycetota bacterium]